MSSEFPLPLSNPTALNLLAKPLAQLDRLILAHIEEGRYPGCQIAIARHGQLALYRTYGDARIAPTRLPAADDTLWLLFSNTKMLTMAAIWGLVDDGILSFHDRIADHIPEFARHGKDAVTIFDAATHQAGFPGADVSRTAWTDHARMRAEVCAFPLEWPTGSRLHYHGRGAHLALAMVIEAVTNRDYRDAIRERVTAPLGLADELFVGVPLIEQHRCADIHAPPGDQLADNSPAFREAGLPHGGGFGTARAMAAFYQMMLGNGRLGAMRVFSRRLIEYVTRDHTGDRPDAGMGGIAMHRGLGPHLRGTGGRSRGLGSLASPWVYGHGGVGTSYCWADPTTGVSFAYLTNFVQPDPWHSLRLDRISSLVHAAVD